MDYVTRFLQNAENVMETMTQDIEEEDSSSSSSSSSSVANVVGTALSYIFLFFLIFGLSATVEIKNLRKQLSNKFAIGTGVAMQFFIMPILGYLSVVSFKNHGFTEAMGVTLLVVTSSPGGSYSNWWCSAFNAELSLSVAMTTVSSLLSIGMLPVNLLFYSFLAYGREEEESILEALDFSTIFVALGIVLGAIVLGLTAGYYYDTPQFHKVANQLGSVSGLLLILFSIFISGSSGGGGDDDSGGGGFFDQPWSFYLGVAFPCLVGISLANMIARGLQLSKPETVAIGIECCYQNTGIGTSVAIAMFDDEVARGQAVAVPLFYGIVEAVAIGLYCVWAWKVGWTKAPADEGICTVIATSYEIDTNYKEEGEPSEEMATLTTTKQKKAATSFAKSGTAGWLFGGSSSSSKKGFQKPPKVVLGATLDDDASGQTAMSLT